MDFSHILKAHAPLSRVQICEYWHQMLEAVHFIHEKGNLVHSDLKPANFLMAKGRLKLIDFGIAQKIPIGTIHISREAIIGTPNYMAPEAIKIAKAHGRRVYKAGKASDVWSLGCILYQMVYGRPPFDRLSGEKKLEAIMDPAHDIPFPPHRVLDDPTSEPVDAPMLEALTTSLRYDAQTRAHIPALLSSELFHHHLGETVTISRKTLRALVVRLQQHAIQGELTDTNAIQRADVRPARLTLPGLVRQPAPHGLIASPRLIPPPLLYHVIGRRTAGPTPPRPRPTSIVGVQAHARCAESAARADRGVSAAKNHRVPV